MTEQETANDTGWRDNLGRQLDQLWHEIKEVSRQVESETRRGGNIARLRFELRGLRRELAEETSRLGHLIYNAQRDSSRRPALAQVKGYDEAVVRIDKISAAIDRRIDAIGELGGDAGRSADAA